METLLDDEDGVITLNMIIHACRRHILESGKSDSGDLPLLEVEGTALDLR